MRSMMLALSLGLSCLALVQARGLVGWPGTFQNSSFCKTYGCTGVTTTKGQGWGPSYVYRLSKLPNTTLHVHMTSTNEIESANLNFNGRVSTQLTASDSKAVLAFLQSATGRNVRFSLAECSKGRPPVQVDEGEGHLYRMSCASVRSTDISREQAAALGITPKMLTSVGVEPQY